MSYKLYNWIASVILVAVFSVPMIAEKEKNERPPKRRCQVVLVDKVDQQKSDRSKKHDPPSPGNRKPK